MEHLGAQLRDAGKKARYLAAFFRGRLVHTNLQLLYNCNFRCRICDFWTESYRDAPRLSLTHVEQVSEKMAQIAPQVVSIGGGEPLLHPDIVGVVRALSRYHFPVMICNGWHMTASKARELFEAGIYEVSISVDYADPARHDKQRGREGAFDRAVRALELLQANRVHSEQRVHMISVVMDDNLDDVEPLLQLCRRIGVTYLVTLYSDHRGHKAPRSIAGDVSRRLLELKRRYGEFVTLRGYIANFSRAIDEGGIGPCFAGKNLCNIDSTGNVSLCIDRLDDAVGNIFDDDAEVIEQRLREAHRKNACRGCWTSCRGSIETLMYGQSRLHNVWDYHQMTKPVAL